jgi:Txe/YoeB family toxin of Txe-Axe toxin-antitoxin module
MFNLLPLNSKISKLLERHSLEKKFTKQSDLLCQNPQHPSLRLELLEPRQHGIYSFRIDRKYRALFIFRTDHQAIEILAITLHYH